MGGEWAETTVGEAFDINPSRTLKRGNVAPFIPMDALPVHARAFERIDYREFTGSGTRFKNGDTLIARITPCLENGKTAYVAALPDNSIGHGSTEYLVLAGRESLSDGLYGYYLARSPDFRRYAIGHMEGTSGRQRVPSTAIEKYVLALPPLTEQRTIAHILGTLDDKIELNRRRNQTLEAMARALFKDWFVDFGPVRTKRRGGPLWPPGEGQAQGPAPTGWQWPRHILDLFPSRIDNEGKPEGWVMGTLGDIAEHQRRSIQPEQIEPDTAYIALEHMPKRCIALSDWGAADAQGSNKYEFKTGEILFGKLRPYFHKVGVAPVDGVCSTDIVVVTATARKWFGFVLCHVSSDEFVEYTNAGSTGTKMPRTSWKDMARYELTLPPASVAEAFDGIIRPWVSEIINGIHESRTLTQLRDTLLPKLISGNLRVKDAESFIERAI